ncbi:unnamed protein product [Diatraea saccharalis]|uniref:Uncharacterized protein n=1 Tax=Diatraea saccharalis TaxID=40085 RepID=A0A9N9WID9_9NEOP|nr:unnamed protein product [Diatraea saccharalis]
MSSKVEIGSPILEVLPPFICPNLREKIVAEEVDINELEKQAKKKKAKDSISNPCIQLVKALPLYPLTITWSPDHLHFEIKDNVIEQKLWVWNTSYRTIYIHCCGLCDETAYLGATWNCCPQTRFNLAPGLKGELFIRATPKEEAPVPYAFAKLQLAAAHKRDHVTGFFAVPVMVTYSNFVSYTGEGG